MFTDKTSNILIQLEINLKNTNTKQDVARYLVLRIPPLVHLYVAQ